MTGFLAVCAAAVATHGMTANTTLREAGAAAGLYVGSQFKYAAIFNASLPAGAVNLYREVHRMQYGLSTVGNDCKWQATHPEEGTFTLDQCNASLGYARGTAQAFRGHNLCWGNNNPKWLLDGNFSAADLRGILTEHITTVMRGVQGAYAWDVVNEAVANTAQPGFFKPSLPWYPAVPDYVDMAFRAARAADPLPLLFYNDFGAEMAGTAKSDLVFAMVTDLVARGVPIDGVGLQMHVGTPQGGPPGGQLNATLVSQNIARIGKLGLQVHITEMDVKCPDPCDDAALQKQATVYAEVLRACLENKGICTSFETWGFTDGFTWLTGARCPTSSCHPLPFDENYVPKPAVAAMLAVLAEFAR